MWRSTYPTITGVCCTFKSIKLHVSEPKWKLPFFAMLRKAVLKLESWMTIQFFFSLFVKKPSWGPIFFISQLHASVCVEKQLCSPHCVFNNSQPIYSLSRRHMHSCFYCFPSINCLCSYDNDQDRLHLSKYSGKYKLMVNKIDLVKDIFARVNRCDYFYVYRLLEIVPSWNCVDVTFQARNICSFPS